MHYPIPEEAFESHIAVLGDTGSGKSSTAKTIIEHEVKLVKGLVANNARVCILDPIKSDWWGITSSVDGKSPGLPFHILGGPHGHVPLHHSAGKTVGELVASGALPLSILDMADFGPGGQSKFFVDFAETIYRKNKGVLYLVMEEAHEFAPKERSGLNAENMSIFWAKRLGTGSRTKGIRLIVCTQRVQSLHNAVLGSCPTLVAHRITMPANQKPVIDWIAKNTNKDVTKRVEESISSLPDGTAWVCNSRLKHFALTPFPRIQTYDNTKTPSTKDKVREVITAPVDKEALRAILGNAAAEAEANDPVKLKARIRELEVQQRAPTKPTITITEDIDRKLSNARITGYRAGYRDATKEVSNAVTTAHKQFSESINDLGRFHEHHFTTLLNIEKRLAEKEARQSLIDAEAIRSSQNGFSLRSTAHPINKLMTHKEMNDHLLNPETLETFGVELPVPPIVQKIVDTIHGAYPVSMSFDAAARRAGVSKRSSAYRKYRKLVEGCAELEKTDGKLRSLPQYAQKGAMDSNDSISMWVNRLPPSYGKMLQSIYDAGNLLSKEQIADRAGISKTSSGLGSGLRELINLELIVERNGGYLMAEGFTD